jgi:hypothetical protein
MMRATGEPICSRGSSSEALSEHDKQPQASELMMHPSVCVLGGEGLEVDLAFILQQGLAASQTLRAPSWEPVVAQHFLNTLGNTLCYIHK